MDTPIIMVQIADRPWTQDVLHRACALAREMNAGIALVKMVAVQHLSWLGTEFGSMNFTDQDRAEIRDYEATVEDYGVPCSFHIFQYATLIEAISEAADHVNARLVFAALPTSIIPYWPQFQRRRLARHLSRHGRELFDPNRTVAAEIGDLESVSSIPTRSFPDH